MDKIFGRIATTVAHATGRPRVFVGAVALILLWGLSGPVFGFSDTWQLIVNTGTTIVTFLMVFLIQNTQNRDGAAIQVKLDELIRASKAQNIFMGIEHLTEKEIAEFQAKCREAAARHGAARTGALSEPPRVERPGSPNTGTGYPSPAE